ncbi:MAG TPA: molybdenum cofactor carrier protein, partial [Thermoanaerobaculia bacterium]|nr:molybdenum cofactor carrier protein [Thermoanaerobaculia bacterium]
EGTSAMSRNHVNVLSSSALIALPGGAGTASEIELAVRYKKPVIVYAPDERLVSAFPKSVPRAATIQEVEGFLRGVLGPVSD